MGADERRRARSELDIRAELKSADLDEDTGVIEQAAISRAPKSSTPAPARGIVAILSAKPSWGMVVIVVTVIAALAFGGMLRPFIDHLMGWKTK